MLPKNTFNIYPKTLYQLWSWQEKKKKKKTLYFEMSFKKGTIYKSVGRLCVLC